MKSEKQQPGITTNQGLFILVVILVIGFVVIVWVSSMSGWSTSSTKEDTSVAAINSCIDSATQTFKQQWPDGENKDIHEGHQLNMNYLNAQIDCYTPYNQDGVYDDDVNRIKDRLNDEQATYATQSQAANSAQSNRTNCTTSAIGSTAFTSCY